jgi:hypothetical protein
LNRCTKPDNEAQRRARIVAEQVLQERVTSAPYDKRSVLLERICAIRAGILDGAPEVEAARRAFVAAWGGDAP